MSDDWRKRLVESIGASGKSHSKISQEAGFDPSYVGKLCAENSTLAPTLPKVMAICKVIEVSPAYIVTGVRNSKLNEDLLTAAAGLTGSQVRIVLEMMRELASNSRQQ